MKRALLVSHRLGGYDGISSEAEKWRAALTLLGWTVTRAAGQILGDPLPDDTIIDGLWADEFGADPPPLDAALIAELCASHGLVVLENLGTLWTLPLAAACFEAEILRSGVPSIIKHSDPPWQTPHASIDHEHVLPLHDPRMMHVTINDLTRAEFVERFPGIAPSIETVYVSVDLDAANAGDRPGTRALLGVPDSDVLVVHPARNVFRKNVSGGVRIAEQLRTESSAAHYWLTDPAGPVDTDGSVTVHRGNVATQSDLWAAADVVALPSIWEGWGLPVVEAAAAGVLVMAGPYPVLDEIRALGVVVFDPSETDTVRGVLADPALYADIGARSREGVQSLSIARLPATIERLIGRARESIGA